MSCDDFFGVVLPIIQAPMAGVQDSALAVQVSTAHLLCTETNTRPVHRTAIKSEGAHKTVITDLFSCRPARGIVNRVIKELGPLNNQAPEFPLASMAITALRKQGEASGSGDFSPLWCGQNPYGCKQISAAELTQELAVNVKLI